LDLHATVAPRRQGANQTPTLESHVFVPYVESNLASTGGGTSLAEYSLACNSLVLQKLRHLIEVGTHNGLQNRELMCRLFSEQSTDCSSVPDDKLRQYLEAADCSIIKTLGKIFSVDHTDQFIEDVQSIVRSAWSDIAVVDKLTSFIRGERCFKTCLDVVLENLPVEGSDTSIKVVEYDAGIGRAFQHTVRQLSSQPALSLKYLATGLGSDTQGNGEPSEWPGVTAIDWSLNCGKPVPDQLRKSDIVILANVLHRQSNLVTALESLKELLRDGGFLLVIEPTSNFAIPWALFALTNDLNGMSDIESRSFGPFCDESTWSKKFTDVGLQVVARKSDGLLNSVFLCRYVPQAAAASGVVSIDVDGTSFSWLEEVKAVMINEQSSSQPVWLMSAKKPVNGVVGMINCLRREPNGNRLR
jgi:fatty acid synthase, animal type